jgi:peptide/nickel transport system substrate-binding protein
MRVLEFQPFRPFRRFLSLSRGALAGFGFFFALALFSGCAGRDSTTGGGTIIIGSGQDPKSLFPPAAANIVAREIYEQLFQRLADRGPALNTLGDSGFVPRLAQRWEWSADSLRITFHLDPHARWQDGHPVSAADVKFAFDVYTDSLVGSRERAGLLAVMDSISIGDSVTCTAWYHQRSPEQFDEFVTSVIPLPAHLLGTARRDSLATSAFSRDPIGNGPFKLVKWEQPVRLEIAPSGSYFGPRPALDRVIWLFAPDASTLFKQFTAGETDFIENVSADDAAAIAKQPDLRIVRLGSYAYNFLTFNMFDGGSDRPNPLFGNRELRRALTMLLDRQLLVRSVFDTLGRVALGPFVRAQWSADTGIAQIAFDREKGGRLLDSLGWRAAADGVRARNGHRLEFSLLVPPSAARQRMSVLIQEQLRLAGVSVKIEKLDGQAMTDRATKHAFDALMGGWTATPSPAGINQTWTTAAARGSGLNWGRYENPRFDAHVDSAITARAKSAAMAHYRAAYQIAADDPPAIWLYEPPLLAAANARLRTGAMRADAWWRDIPGWSIVPGKKLPRDAAPAKAP